MKDEQIIKALEESISFDEPYESDFTLIRIEYIKNALDLINRQKAEIERLKAVKKHIDTVIHRDCEYPTEKSYNEAFQKTLSRLYDNIKLTEGSEE